MGPPPPPAPAPRGLSLYDNLTDPNDPTPDASSATISSAPVRYGQPEQPKKPLDPALRFQPIRRPQPKQGNRPGNRPKPPTTTPAAQSSTPAPAPAAATSATAPAPGAAAPPKSTLADWTATAEDEYLYGTGEKRQRGGRKRNKKRHDDAPAHTNWHDIYDPARPTNIDEFLVSDEKVDEVREWRALLHRRRRAAATPDSDSDADDARAPPPNQFAPPPSYFAPPPPSPPTETTGATISRAPIRYSQPDDEPPAPNPDPDQDAPDDAPRSNRPGQSGFAKRLMTKYGWTRGTGLGADSSGILNPLRVTVDKRRKKADADGGGWAEPANKGRIVGGNTRQQQQGSDDGPKMSEVIVLRHMLDGMENVQGEIEDGLGQEIGEECGEKYGRVERLYIDQVNLQVFIKFTDQVSALRAVNELRGRIFNGNTIQPAFYDLEKFDNGIYI